MSGEEEEEEEAFSSSPKEFILSINHLCSCHRWYTQGAYVEGSSLHMGYDRAELPSGTEKVTMKTTQRNKRTKRRGTNEICYTKGSQRRTTTKTLDVSNLWRRPCGSNKLCAIVCGSKLVGMSELCAAVTVCAYFCVVVGFGLL